VLFKKALTSNLLLKMLYNLCSKAICTVLDDHDLFFPAHIHHVKMLVVYGCASY